MFIYFLGLAAKSEPTTESCVDNKHVEPDVSNEDKQNNNNVESTPPDTSKFFYYGISHSNIVTSMRKYHIHV